MNYAKLRGRVPLIFSLGFLFFIPLFYSDTYTLHVMIISFCYAVIAMNFDLLLGYAGVFSCSQFAFFSIGSYTSAILALRLGVSPWIGVFAGAGAAALAGLVVGLLTLRLKGFYISLFTFAFQMVFYSVLLMNPYELTGGTMGLLNIPSFQLGTIKFGGLSKIPDYYLFLFIFLVSTFIMLKTVGSHIGLAFIALRDHEEYAICRGINPYKYKTIAFVISVFFTGLMGGFYAHYLHAVDLYIMSWGTMALGMTMLVVGGIGTIYGPIIASFFLTFLVEFLSGMGPLRFILVSSLMIVVLIFAPSGLMGILQRTRARGVQQFPKFLNSILKAFSR